MISSSGRAVFGASA
jgi:hypothetical protein